MIKIGNTQYLLPLHSNGFYVSDARGNTVLECQDYDAAKQMAILLNSQSKKDLK